MGTLDEFNSAAILALVVAFLIGLLLVPVFDAVRRLLARAKMAYYFRRDKRMGYTWQRSWKRAGQS